MGLFSRKKEKRTEKEAPSLEDLSGMTVEVLGTEGELLFTARLSVGLNGTAKLWQMVESPTPIEEQLLPVQLRGFQSSSNLAVHLEGIISPAEGMLWTVEHLRLLGKDNDRAFFRQDTRLAGEVRLAGPGGGNGAPCEILNLSAGGVRLSTAETFQEGDRLVLTTTLREGGVPLALLCEVRRAMPKGKGGEYGCSFVNLDGKKEDQISQAIMEMQRKKLKW